MTFDEAIVLIEDQNILHLKVRNFAKEIVLRVSEESPNKVADKFRSHQNTLMSYGKITVEAATEKIERANWKDAFHWSVTFAGVTATSTPSHTYGIPEGYLSAKEVMLQQQLNDLKADIKYKKQLEDLEKRLIGRNPKESDIDKVLKLLPFAPLVVKMSPDQVNAIGAISNLINGLNGQTPQTNASTAINGINGPETQNIKVEMSEAEQDKVWEKIEEQLNLLSEKVEIGTILQFITSLNEKPQFLQTLIDLSKNYK